MSAVDLKGKFDDMMARGKLLCAGITCRRCSDMPNSFMILGKVFSSVSVDGIILTVITNQRTKIKFSKRI